MQQNHPAHVWHFFRSGGFDQVQFDRPADLQHLDELDPKLWAALSCPSTGLHFDARTLAFIDSDKDGRIRVPELRAAVAWACARLASPQALLDGGDLLIAQIQDRDEDGRKLRAAAARLLRNLGASDRASLSVTDTDDRARLFPPQEPNGDGVVPVARAGNIAEQQLLDAVIASQGGIADRSGEPGITADTLTAFETQAREWLTWRNAGKTAEIAPCGADSQAALAALDALREKIDDFFTRCALAGFDARAVGALNGRDDDFLQLSAQALHNTNADVQRLPLARIEAGRELPLQSGINPGWQAAMAAFVAQVVTPLLGQKTSLSAEQWQALQNRFAPVRAWLAAKPSSAVESCESLESLLQDTTLASVRALIEVDLAVKDEAEAMDQLDQLIRYTRHLKTLLNNFISFADFYTRRDKAVFQFGRLYLDGRSCDLVLRVNDAGKHAALAAHSGTYLVYCDCSRAGSTEKVSIVAAVTAGGSGNLLVGRNGVFFDREGRDWDASITRIIDNPISVSQAFWTPYRRVAKLINDQAQKMAAAKDKAVEDKAAGGVSATAGKVDSGDKPAAPAPFDVAKFAGIFAAIGLAIGAIGTAMASVLTGFMALVWWQMPLALVGLSLAISGPSMIMAWFKLRKRNLAPLLDANGWAVNTEAKLTLAFGRTLTQNAQLPAGAQRSLRDPYAEKGFPWLSVLVFLGLVAAAAWWWTSRGV